MKGEIVEKDSYEDLFNMYISSSLIKSNSLNKLIRKIETSESHNKYDKVTKHKFYLYIFTTRI